MEEWRTICGYEGLYQVSNYGKVKSLKYDKEKILKFGKKKNGYLFVILCKEGKKKQFLVHRLVVNAFIPNPSSLPCVNHKDENKTNNQVDNLEWCTYQYNIKYGTCQQRKVENTDWKAIGRKNAEKQSKKVYQYSQDGELIKIWQSTMECGRNGFKQSAVANCCIGYRKSHRGYIWSYTPL